MALAIMGGTEARSSDVEPEVPLPDAFNGTNIRREIMSARKAQDQTVVETPVVETTEAAATAIATYRAAKVAAAAKRAERKVARTEGQEAVTDGRPRKMANGRLSARGFACLCGCGNPTVQRDARFISGHDAKMRAEIRRANMVPEALPEIARPFFENGEALGGLMLVDGIVVDVKAGGWA